VAHIAARRGPLPPNFNRWEWADQDGWTAAHEAAEKGRLPPDFDRWELTDSKGWTVAQLAYELGYLPDDFPFYGLFKPDGDQRYVAGGPSMHIVVNRFKGKDKYRGMSNFHNANVFL